MSLATGAKAIMAWALRGTKQLSPVTRTSKMTMFGKKSIGGKKLRPWAQWTMGSPHTGLGWAGIGKEGRTKALYAYGKGYKHLKKHKKLYGAGVVGAAAWDFLPGKDNPKA